MAKIALTGLGLLTPPSIPLSWTPYWTIHRPRARLFEMWAASIRKEALAHLSWMDAIGTHHRALTNVLANRYAVIASVIAVPLLHRRCASRRARRPGQHSRCFVGMMIGLRGAIPFKRVRDQGVPGGLPRVVR